MGWEVAKTSEKVSRVRQSSFTAKPQSPEQSIVGHETQWTQPWSRVRSQVDVIHWVRSTGAIVSSPHLHSAQRPIKLGSQMYGVMIAIEYSYRKNILIYVAN